MDTFWNFVDKHFLPIMIFVGVVFVIAIALSIALFHDLMDHYDDTVKAMRRFVQFVRGLRGAAKGDAAPAGGDLAQTISEPIDASTLPKPPVKQS